MVTTLKTIESAIMHLNYNQTSYNGTHKKTYYKTVYKDGKPGVNIIVSMDPKGAVILTAEGIQVAKGIAAAQFEDATPDDVLVIVLDQKNTHDIKGDNIIFYNRNMLKVKGNVSERFYDELAYLKGFNKERKRDEKHQITRFGLPELPHSAIVVYALAAFLVYTCFFITYGKSEIYGISAENVLKHGESYRLVTYMLTHGGIGHLIGNCASLVVIGRLYAKRRNFLDFAIIFFGGGIISGIGSVLFRLYVSQEVTHVTVGASGAVLAVLGGLLMSVLLDDGLRGYKKSYIAYALGTILISSMGANIDHACHIAGLLSGMCLEFILSKADAIYAATLFIESRDKTKTSF